MYQNIPLNVYFKIMYSLTHYIGPGVHKLTETAKNCYPILSFASFLGSGTPKNGSQTMSYVSFESPGSGDQNEVQWAMVPRPQDEGGAKEQRESKRANQLTWFRMSPFMN